MTVKAAYKYIGEPADDLTVGNVYPAFELFGALTTIDDAGNLSTLNHSAHSSWQLVKLDVDGDTVYEREQPQEREMAAKQPEQPKKDEGDEGQSGTGGREPEGRDAAKDQETKGRGTGEGEEGGQGRTEQG